MTVELLLLEKKGTAEREGKKRPREPNGDGTSTHPGSRLPLKVRAFYNGQMRELKATSPGTWASVSWPHVSNIYDTSCYDESDSEYDNYGGTVKNYVAYQLILEFNDTSFAEGERQVLTHLSKLLDTQSMADVTFVVKKKKIDAHSAIVVSGSSVICAMLEEDKFKEGRTKVVKVDDIDPVVFKEVLRYLYTGKTLKLDEDDMTERLFLAADKYQIEGLMDLCEQNLIKKLNMQTIFHYLVLAHQHTAPQLLEASIKFLVEHKNEVWDRPEWKDLMKSYPDLFFSASHRMSL